MYTFLLVVGLVVGIAYIYHSVVVKGKRCKSKAKLRGKTVIVTGKSFSSGFHSHFINQCWIIKTKDENSFFLPTCIHVRVIS